MSKDEIELLPESNTGSRILDLLKRIERRIVNALCAPFSRLPEETAPEPETALYGPNKPVMVVFDSERFKVPPRSGMIGGYMLPYPEDKGGMCVPIKSEPITLKGGEITPHGMQLLGAMRAEPININGMIGYMFISAPRPPLGMMIGIETAPGTPVATLPRRLRTLKFSRGWKLTPASIREQSAERYKFARRPYGNNTRGKKKWLLEQKKGLAPKGYKRIKNLIDGSVKTECDYINAMTFDILFGKPTIDPTSTGRTKVFNVKGD